MSAKTLMIRDRSPAGLVGLHESEDGMREAFVQSRELAAESHAAPGAAQLLWHFADRPRKGEGGSDRKGGDIHHVWRSAWLILMKDQLVTTSPGRLRPTALALGDWDLPPAASAQPRLTHRRLGLSTLLVGASHQKLLPSRTPFHSLPLPAAWERLGIWSCPHAGGSLQTLLPPHAKACPGRFHDPGPGYKQTHPMNLNIEKLHVELANLNKIRSMLLL